MTLRSPEIMAQLADLYAGGFSLNNCARKLGISNRTVHSWLKASRENSPDTITTYLDEPMQFARALSIARQLLYLNMRSNFEARMLSGDETPVFFQGRPCFVEMEEAVGLDEDTRDLLGYPRDGILRDERGRRVQHVIKTAAPVAGVLAALAVGYPDEWTPSSKTETTVINKTQGVTSVPAPTSPPQIPPRPPAPPQLEILNDVTDADYEDLLGPVPVAADADDDEPEPVVASDPGDDDKPEPQLGPGEPKPEIKIAVSNPPEYTPAQSTRPISDKLAGLLRR